MKKVGYETFMQMLKELDQYIAKEYDPSYVLEVRAIGGFAMIAHEASHGLDATRRMVRGRSSNIRNP